MANVWTGAQRPALAAVVTGSGATADTHTAAVQVGVELLGAGVLTLISGSSAKAGNVSLLIVAALWVLWFVHGGSGRPGSLAAQANPFRTPGTVSPPVPTGPPVGTGPAQSGGGVPYSRQIPGLPPIPGMPYPSH